MPESSNDGKLCQGRTGMRAPSIPVLLTSLGCQRDPKIFPWPILGKSDKAYLAAMQAGSEDSEHGELWG